eukprot:TRINITY_DN36078_c0_g1_i1.p1 TRINITY_DN36078_c0_g1~~TRINITY_DN36078_c0_g1_i1.p1  ORF type:complete len:193 (-),score=41.47 TRINITY_DN36078_c0_g1_i1:26-604(-)
MCIRDSINAEYMGLYREIQKAIDEEHERKNKISKSSCLLDEISENISEDEEFKSLEHTIHKIPESISNLHNRFLQQYKKGKVINLEPHPSKPTPISTSWETKVKQNLQRKLASSGHHNYSTQLPSPERNIPIKKHRRHESVSKIQRIKTTIYELSLIHISEPTRPLYISYAVFCLKKKNETHKKTTHNQKSH